MESSTKIEIKVPALQPALVRGAKPANYLITNNLQTMRYKIIAEQNGNLQTEISCDECRLAQWVDYLLTKGFTFKITHDNGTKKA